MGKGKRIRVLDTILIMMMRDKLGFKSPIHDIKHFTLKFRENGILDVHETVEGRVKEYREIAKINLAKFGEPFREAISKKLSKLFREINVNDPEYHNLDARILPTVKIENENGKELILDERNLEDLGFTVPIRDLGNYNFNWASFERNGEEYTIFLRNGKYFIIKIDDLKLIFDKVFAKAQV